MIGRLALILGLALLVAACQPNPVAPDPPIRDKVQPVPTAPR